MSKYRDKTNIGGPQESFQTTQWSELYRVETTNEDRRSIIIDTLLKDDPVSYMDSHILPEIYSDNKKRHPILETEKKSFLKTR